MSKAIDLYEFLMEAELHQYYSELKNDLKVPGTSHGVFYDRNYTFFFLSIFQVTTVPQVKFATDDDLYQIGMTRPEIRRLKKYFQKYYPQNYFSKFKKVNVPTDGQHGQHFPCRLR